MGWFGGSDGGDTSGDTGFASKKKSYDYGDTGSTSSELDLRCVRDEMIDTADTRIMINNGHLLTSTLGTLDFLEIF